MLTLPTWVSVLFFAFFLLVTPVVARGIFVAAKAVALSPRRQRAVAAIVSAVLIGWGVSGFVLGALGVYRARPESWFQPFLVGFFLPLVLGAVLLRTSATLRAFADAVPSHWLVGVQFVRVLGGIFFVALALGGLPSLFAVPAATGDVLVGISAPFVAYFLLAGKPWARAAAVWWNLFGLLDFVVALGTGYFSAPTPYRLFEVTPSTELVTVFPLIWIPIFGVPFTILLHALSLRQLLGPTAAGAASASIRRSRAGEQDRLPAG